MQGKHDMNQPLAVYRISEVRSSLAWRKRGVCLALASGSTLDDSDDRDVSRPPW